MNTFPESLRLLQSLVQFTLAGAAALSLLGCQNSRSGIARLSAPEPASLSTDRPRTVVADSKQQPTPKTTWVRHLHAPQRRAEMTVADTIRIVNGTVAPMATVQEQPTDVETASRLGLTEETVQRLHKERALDNFALLTMPEKKRARALFRLQEPKPDHPGEALAFRLEQMSDETGQIPEGALIRALNQRRAMGIDPASWAFTRRPPKLGRNGLIEDDLTAGIEPGSWTGIGPGNIGGRVRAIVIHPTIPTTMWTGSAGGGLWKTTNGGASWAPLNDFLASLAACALVLDPTNPDVLYAGTGEGFYNGDGLRGAGIFKSINGGTTWTQLGSTANSNFHYVNRLAISPANGQIILAATRSGIWRSTDGGGTWTRRATTDAKDVDFHPTDGTKAIASGSGGSIRYSNDGGVTWPNASGVRGERIEVAYAKSNPLIVYASAETDSSGELYRSVNGGASYTLQNTGTNYLGGQGWYDNALWVDPTNPDIVIVGGIDLYRSVNAGVLLTQISEWYSAPRSAHADHHIIVNHPGYNGTTNNTVYFGNDGGVYRASNVRTVARLSGWQELNNNFAVTQFYGGAGNPTTGVIIGGTQDNGTLRYTTAGGAENWTAMFGGDGGWCAADPTNSNYFYGEYVYLQIHRSTNGGVSSDWIYNGITEAKGGSANFIAPFILDPNNANTLLGGAESLWRSTNVRAATPTWSAIKAAAVNNPVSAIAVAKGNSNVIWIGHNNGDIYKTANGTAAAPAWTRADLGTPNLPNRFCHRIVIDPSDTTRIYACFGGFNGDNIYRTINNGANWTDVSGALPSAPVRSLQIAPFNSNYLYAGTEVGVFASANGGGTWSPSNEGPANVSVDELFWVRDRLIAATHGRGFFSIVVAETLVPEIVVEQPAGTGLADGRGAQQFGNVEVGNTSVLTFTVRNTGTGALTGLSVSKDGANSAEFAISALGATTLAPTATTTFTVTFAPSAIEVRSAALHLASNDADENPFDIALTGTGAPPTAPEVAVEQPAGTGLADGAESRDFGTVAMEASETLTFTVRNVGTRELSGLSIGKDGVDADDFSVGALGATTLAPDTATTFDITFEPGASGPRSAAVHLASNDADENSFDIALAGTGAPSTSAEIVLEQPAGAELSDGTDGRDFGTIAVGSSSALTFTMRNTGSADLSGLSVAVDGANAGEFTARVGEPTLPPNGSTTLTVTFTPAGLGSRAAAFHVASTDADENPFDVAITGMGSTGAGLILAGSVVHDGDAVGGAGNADGTLNPGEEIDLDVLLRNDGGVLATGVNATLTTASPFVTIDDADETWSDIAPGGTVQSGGDFDFAVLSTTPVGHVIDFNVFITTNEASYTRTFSMTVVETPLAALLPDLLVGASGAQMLGNGIYNLDGSNQRFGGKMARRRSKAFFVKVENDGAETQSLILRCEGKKKWFHEKIFLGALNITREVTSPSGYTFPNVAPGQSRFLKVKIHSRGGPRRAQVVYTFDLAGARDGIPRDVAVLGVRQR